MQVKEKAHIKGEYYCFSLKKWTRKNGKTVARLREFIKTGNRAILTELMATGAILGVKHATNLIPTVGRSVIARILAGDTTYSGEVNYGALGSGTTAFTNSSAKLNTEVYRKQAASQSYDSNVAYIDWFIEAADVANQTFEEFGAFIDGSAAADSGQAWSLLITGGWVKSGSMFVSAKYTINN